jgi:glutamate dehydrogenase
MSGDVFGNGMLLSRQIRLVAAFDHRHVFLDPDPDPETSLKERERLFRLPTSSWDDYDRGLISEGGGVYDRAEKEIHLSPQSRARLGVDQEVLNGDEMIQAILRAPADLLWNGGIGTYVKATTETHPDVGDPGNDRVRVDAPDVRATVIGEGGNLGLTQSARVECALGGCRLNTDALDNSGGVDMSDREVNLKILLDAALERGTLDPERRNGILRECTEAVSEAVLANNHAQSLAVSLDERRAEADPTPFLDTMLRLEREGLLDPGLESLPTPDDLAERQADGGHLTRPELAVLLAFAKLHLKQWLLASEIPEDPAMLDLVRSYFPQRALSLAGEEELKSHRLRAHIASTVLTNRFVDRMGATAHIRLMGETGQSAATIARTWYIANRVVDADALYEDMRDSDSEVRAGAQCQWYLEMGEALERATRWFFEFGDLGRDIHDAIDWYREPVSDLRASLPGLLTGERLEAFRSRIALYEMDGLSTETACQLSTFLFIDELLPIARLIRQTSMPAEQVGAVYLGIAEDIDFPWLRGRLDAHAGRDFWKQRAARILNGRLVAARSRISARILRDAGESSRIEDGMERFRRSHGNALQRIRNVVEDVRSAGAPDLAALIVAVDAVDDPDFAATAMEHENGY